MEIGGGNGALMGLQIKNHRGNRTWQEGLALPENVVVKLRKGAEEKKSVKTIIIFRFRFW